MALGESYRPSLGAFSAKRRRSDALRGLQVLTSLAALALAGELLYIALASPRFAVRAVAVRGDPQIVQHVADRIQLPANTNILRAPTKLLKRQVEALPAVRRARVARRFPRRLVVTFERREPVAVIRRADGATLIDPEGVAFTVSDEWGWGLPEFAAPHLTSGDVKSEEARDEISALLGVLRALGPDPRLRATRLRLVDARRLEVTLNSGARVNMGRGTALEAKARFLGAALDQIGAHRISYLDLADPQAAFWVPRDDTVSAALR